MIYLRILVFCLVGSSFIVGMQPGGELNIVYAKDASDAQVLQPSQSSLPKLNAGDVARFVSQVSNNYKTVLEKNKSLFQDADWMLQELPRNSSIMAYEVSQLANDDPELVTIYNVFKQINTHLGQSTPVSLAVINKLFDSMSALKVVKIARNIALKLNADDVA